MSNDEIKKSNDEIKKAWGSIIDFCKNQIGCDKCPLIAMGCNWDMCPSEDWAKFEE